jgi:hypothetical protein
MTELEKRKTARQLLRAAAFSFVHGAAAAAGGCVITVLAWWAEHR